MVHEKEWIRRPNNPVNATLRLQTLLRNNVVQQNKRPTTRQSTTRTQRPKNHTTIRPTTRNPRKRRISLQNRYEHKRGNTTNRKRI